MCEYIRIPVPNGRIFRNVRRAARARGMTYEDYLVEVIEAHTAEFEDLVPGELLGVQRRGPGRPRKYALVTETRVDVHRSNMGIPPEDVQRILYLHFVEDLSVPVIATRFGRGQSTIQRIVTTHKQAEHVPLPAASGSNAGRGQEIRFGKGV